MGYVVRDECGMLETSGVCGERDKRVCAERQVGYGVQDEWGICGERRVGYAVRDERHPRDVIPHSHEDRFGITQQGRHVT